MTVLVGSFESESSQTESQVKPTDVTTDEDLDSKVHYTIKVVDFRDTGVRRVLEFWISDRTRMVKDSLW